MQYLTFTDMLKRWPIRARASEEIGVPYDTLVAWESRNSIPVEYWSRVIAAAEARKIKGISQRTLETAKVARDKIRPAQGRRRKEKVANV